MSGELKPCPFDDSNGIWTEHLTEAQLAMVFESGGMAFGNELGGCGVELNGSAAWRTARSLVSKGIGTIEGGAPNSSELPGLYFNNEQGVRIIHEFDEGGDD